MFVRVKCLRRGGRRIPDHEADHQDNHFCGDLQTRARAFEVHPPLSSHGPLRVLYDASVVVILSGASGGMLIRGYEECRGAAVLQEWEVRPLAAAISQDGIARWEWPDIPASR
ncbi:hypothetical protein [Pseudothauera rhizosphaerae]|uniref:Uncharacterized protein n=1 Tax=Pseudothauera rhizosphaerae TaxID=2565932 RepID=A0A4S4AAH2_9RHOO|nr:hypothetical protein [Pseudothauera rhizosphaerae]THF55896.1 hypothetical protein E6O51_20130 [Pseudothauera rhizosphaerae]